LKAPVVLTLQQNGPIATSCQKATEKRSLQNLLLLIDGNIGDFLRLNAFEKPIPFVKVQLS
jgi:hypothetical protein